MWKPKKKTVPAVLLLKKCYYASVETASTLLYVQETTTTQLQSQSCFPDRLAILDEVRILSNN